VERAEREVGWAVEGDVFERAVEVGMVLRGSGTRL